MQDSKEAKSSKQAKDEIWDANKKSLESTYWSIAALGVSIISLLITIMRLVL